MKKANDFYEILNAVEFNSPIEDVNDDFFTDFKGLRKGFNERKIYKLLNINPNTKKCNNLTSPQRVFLSGHRGTGKTTELLKLKNDLNDTKCFLTVFCNITAKEINVFDIDIVDIILVLLEELLSELNKRKVPLETQSIESFYNWFNDRVVEINNRIDTSSTILNEKTNEINILSFYQLVKDTIKKLSGSKETKDTIRKIFENKFPDFSLKFNELIIYIKQTIQKENIAKDLIFIVDGFEKIGDAQSKKKILIDNSTKFIEIKSNIIISLPIELFSQANLLNDFSNPISFPLITLDSLGKKQFYKFITKRIDEKLFENENTINQIIKYGAGSPRETLKIIAEAYFLTDDDKEVITLKSVNDAKNKISNDIVNYLTDDELMVLKELDEKKSVLYSDTLAQLLVKKVILEYGDGEDRAINPIILENETYIKLSNKVRVKTYIQKKEKENIPKEDIPTIKEIEIKNFFSIDKLNLNNLGDKKEIYIVGENGDGKTLILQAITLALKGIKEGRVIDFLKGQDDYIFSITNNDDIVYDTKNETPYRNLFAYGANRNNNCKKEDEETGYLTLFDNRLDLKDPEKWLIDLYNAEQSEESSILSVDDAKKLLKKLLTDDIEINITYNSVEFLEKNAPVSFEQLSAGYKGVITIIGDLIVRLSQNQPYITDTTKYRGVVLIDEVELHLHPKWKYNFIEKLRDVFEEIQFIVTTHSPTVILGAREDAVFYKVYKDDGQVYISNQIENEGYTHNSLVSSPLFDLKHITSKEYEKDVNSSDYIFSKIHESVAKKIKENINISQEEISQTIEDGLASL